MSEILQHCYLAASNICYRLFKHRDYWHNRHNHPYLDIQELGRDEVRVKWRGRLLCVASTTRYLEAPSRRCHIIASGPSIESVSHPARLFDHPTICLDESFEIAEAQGLRPDFYMVSGPRFVAENFALFRRGVGICKSLVADAGVVNAVCWQDPRMLSATNLHYYRDLLHPFRRNRIRLESDLKGHRDLLIDSKHNVAFSKNPGVGVFSSSTAAYNAVQFALGIGFEEIYIFGMDLNAAPRFYRGNNSAPMSLDCTFSDSVKPGFELLSQYLKGTPCSVFNCSPESRLPEDVLPKIDPNQALEARPPQAEVAVPNPPGAENTRR